MKVIIAYPPLYDRIKKKFDVEGKQVFFCWGDTIYNPSGVDIPPQIHVHERRHSHQQSSDPESWWLKYIDDVDFRLNQEIDAHRDELQFVLSNPRYSRRDRRAAKITIPSRLCGPLYGGQIPMREAKRILMA